MSTQPITTTETVRYTFSSSELVEIAQKQARHLTEFRTLEEELTNIKADYKAKTTAKEGEINQCTNRITSGYEMRPVKCLVLKFRPDSNHKLIVRTDTGTARKEKMSSEEKQLTLSTEENPYVFEADFFGDEHAGTQDCVADHVPMTAKEAEVIREAVEVRPLRNLIEA